MIRQTFDPFFFSKAERESVERYSTSGRFGNDFTFEFRLDLAGGVRVSKSELQHWDNVPELMAAVTEFIGWYAREVYPRLATFAGFDLVKYRLVD